MQAADWWFCELALEKGKLGIYIYRNGMNSNGTKKAVEVELKMGCKNHSGQDIVEEGEEEKAHVTNHVFLCFFSYYILTCKTISFSLFLFIFFLGLYLIEQMYGCLKKMCSCYGTTSNDSMITDSTTK